MDDRFMHDTGVELVKAAKVIIGSYKKFSKAAVDSEDISVCGMEILTSLRYYPEKNTVSEIAESVEVSKGLISREVETLRQKGYITTVVDNNDRRILRIYIADNADEIIKKQKKKLCSLMYQIFDNLDEDELLTLRKFIATITKNAASADSKKDLDIDFDLDSFV